MFYLPTTRLKKIGMRYRPKNRVEDSDKKKHQKKKKSKFTFYKQGLVIRMSGGSVVPRLGPSLK
jgi:hypothetical protein